MNKSWVNIHLEKHFREKGRDMSQFYDKHSYTPKMVQFNSELYMYVCWVNIHPEKQLVTTIL